MSAPSPATPAHAAPPRGFARSELEIRTERAQRAMAAAALDALLLTTEPEFRYFSGFHSQFWESPTRPWFLVVPHAGQPVAVIPAIGASAMARTWLTDIRVWPAPRPEDDGVTLLAQTLREAARRHGRVGVPLGHESHLRMPAADFRRLGEELRGVEMVDATPLVRGLRGVKSDAEIEKIRYVARLASEAFRALPAAAAIGDSERELCRRLRIDLLQRGADASPYLIGASGRGGYDNIIMGPSDRVLAAGDVLVIDTGTTYDGYFCDFDRNIGFGTVDDAALRAYEVVYRATDAGFAAARPGATTSDLWRAMWEVLERGGALGNDVGRLGHGLGMQLTEWPSNTAHDGTRLEPGMVITLEPGMTFAPGKNMVHEEDIVITADGAEMLSLRAPPQLPTVA